VKKLRKMAEEMTCWVEDNFPNIHVIGGRKRLETHSIGLGSVIDKIRDALDPNHIGYMPGMERLEPEEDEVKAAATAG